MTTLRISVDMSGYRQRRQASVRVLGDGIRRAVSEAIIEGADYAREHHPHNTKTGRLVGPELYARVTRTSEKGTEGEIRNDVPYAMFVEFSTAPHRIYAKPGGTLRFEVDGQEYFRKYVDHPGTTEKPFMRPAGDYAGERVAYHTERLAVTALRDLWRA